MYPFHIVFRENTARVEAFVSSSQECQMTCSDDPMCGYFKYFDKVRSINEYILLRYKINISRKIFLIFLVYFRRMQSNQ